MKNSNDFGLYKLLIVLLMAIVSLLVYNDLPGLVPMHWGFDGRPDGFLSKLEHVIIFPLFALGISALFSFLPRLDAKKENYEKIGGIWEFIQFSILIFFCFTYIVSLLYVLIPYSGIGKVMLVGAGLFLIIIGNYIGQLKKSHFLGIKLPWNSSDEKNLTKINIFTGKMFLIAGILSILNGFLLFKNILIFGLVISFVLMIPIFYACMLYRKK
ncbi:MAG: DUF1648 domain-containing protein [Candidatus Gracilibacteria bacterium]|nr:DUF1648 domain-containing protein [Candidatus Gracilibacteria bacterium]